MGGNQLTRDLSVALGMPYYFAEELKEKWGHAAPDIEQAGEEVMLPSFQGQSRRLIRRSTLCKPLIDRLQETLGLIMLRAQQAGLRRLPPGGVVITGGTARIPGFQQMAAEVLACPVRIAAPMGIRGFSPEHNQHALLDGDRAAALGHQAPGPDGGIQQEPGRVRTRARIQGLIPADQEGRQSQVTKSKGETKK